MQTEPAASTVTLEDPQRLEALRRTDLLDSLPEEAFDRISRLASRLLNAPVALVSLVDKDRQFFKSCIGLTGPWASERQTPLSHSFCQHAVTSGKPLIIEDARSHPLVWDNLAIPDLGVVAYAGIPLITSRGHVLGSFCVIDNQPRAWRADEIELLEEFAALVMTEIELRTAAWERARLLESERESSARLRNLADAALRINRAAGPQELLEQAAELACVVTGASRAYVRAHVDLEEPETFEAKCILGAEETTGEHSIEAALEDAGGRSTGSIVAQRAGEDDFSPETEAALVQLAQMVSTGLENSRLQQAAHDAVRSRQELLSVVSHDLKNPLGAVKGFAQLLKRRLVRDGVPNSERYIESLSQIEAASTRMQALINELEDFAVTQTGHRLSLNRQATNLITVVRQAVRKYEQITADRHNLDFTASAMSLIGYWDLPRIERVLDNLLSNAVKYSPEGGEISVTVGREERAGGEWAVVSVRDRGMGIPTSDLPHIFEWYRRAGNATRQVSGSGIGLASALQVVQQHGGSINVESREGDGTTFTVSLPMGAPLPDEAHKE